ncbi:Uncharacterised protein [Dermatophilus congolensis]|uniref:Uncharacterized protein n=1 Tax=Dermatophilus congolensis TaxID=1863 RepID=A0AA46BQG6_9MICO|nr:Uncharacterised protein [Dermatophilus congolensis]
MAFGGHDVTGEAVGGTEVGVASGDHPSDEVSVVGVVEEFDDLFGHGTAVTAASVGGQYENVRLCHLKVRFTGS